MKTFILLIPGLFFITCLQGQTPKFNFKADTSSFSDFMRDLPSIRINPLPDFNMKDFRPRNAIVPENYDPRDRVFPGASRYYAISPFPGGSYSDHFILKPDTKNKYYLIIINPLDSLLRK